MLTFETACAGTNHVAGKKSGYARDPMFPGNYLGHDALPSVQGAQDDLASTTFDRLGDPITVAQITGLWV